ncbi:hypothetical protein FB446DRAFT_792716 [Lentinula raphanica]|nr:hypothetical protein FB446DRAFT_792716 [Lentinula raphanica]
MFKFAFDLDDEDIDSEINSIIKDTANIQIQGKSSSGEHGEYLERPAISDGEFSELSMEHLLGALPTQLSFSPLEIDVSPFSSAAQARQTHHIARRDLFDARFQVMSEDKSDPGVDVEADDKSRTDTNDSIDAPTDPRLEFLNTPSDLVPGVYEGGLKTWECSLDLVNYLHSSLKDEDIASKRILELGCGTGVPSLYLLRRIFLRPPPDPTSPKTTIHFQDYNTSVLELVTFPNVLLSWYMSPASEPFLSSQPASSDTEGDDAVEYPTKDPALAGDLPITPSLKSAFERSLETFNLEIKFLGGSWKSFRNAMVNSMHGSETQVENTGNTSVIKGLGAYDILLTSETIYRTESVPEFLDTMWVATHSFTSTPSRPITDQLAKMAIDENQKPLILVAAKVFYFGVGGGIDEFVEATKQWRSDGTTEVTTVWQQNIGVGRRIVRVFW